MNKWVHAKFNWIWYVHHISRSWLQWLIVCPFITDCACVWEMYARYIIIVKHESLPWNTSEFFLIDVSMFTQLQFEPTTFISMALQNHHHTSYQHSDMVNKIDWTKPTRAIIWVIHWVNKRRKNVPDSSQIYAQSKCFDFAVYADSVHWLLLLNWVLREYKISERTKKSKGNFKGNTTNCTDSIVIEYLLLQL